MSGTPWHKRFHDDALNGYMGLSLEERGAYTTFLDLMYQRGEPVVDNERLIAGWMQSSIRKYRALRDRLIELGKIFLTDDGRISNARFEKERENALKISRKQAENGAKGGEKSAETRKNSNEINDAPQPPLQTGSSYPEARSQRLEDRTDRTEQEENIVVGADAPPPTRRYAFEAKTIKLNHRDLEEWRKAFAHLSLEAELWALDEWASGQKHGWFCPVSSALAKKEREARERINMARMAADRGAEPLRVSGDGRI